MSKKVNLGLFVRLTAKPGKEEDLRKFVEAALPIAIEENSTTAWFAVRFDASTYAIFDVFENEEGRSAHLSGRIAAALMAKASELLVSAPVIERHDVLAAKLP